MPIDLQGILKVAFLCILVLAALGAMDYIVESVRIFRQALERYRERNRH